LSTTANCTDFTEISNAPFTAVPFALFSVDAQNTRYVANAAANYIHIANSFKDADNILDAQIKINEAAIANNTVAIVTNTTAVATKIATTAIVDDLTTGGSAVPLSAEQGKILKNLLDTSVTITVEDNLTSTSATNALSENQGKVLKGLLDTKVPKNSVITAGTKTKITYDANGLVTAGADATTADINASADRNYVTDAELVVISNTSGANSGDQTAAEVTTTATGAIIATDVDSAIAELEDEKLALAGGTMVGNIDMGTKNISNATSITTGNIIDSGSNKINTENDNIVTINSISGRFRITGTNFKTINNNKVNENSIIICKPASADSSNTTYISEVEAAEGSFTVTLEGTLNSLSTLLQFV